MFESPPTIVTGYRRHDRCTIDFRVAHPFEGSGKLVYLFVKTHSRTWRFGLPINIGTAALPQARKDGAFLGLIRTQTTPHMARFSVGYGSDRSIPIHSQKNAKISHRNKPPDVGVRSLLYASVAVSILIAVNVPLNTLGLAGQKMRLQRSFCLPIVPPRGCQRLPENGRKSHVEP